jgi:hypothetical protein
MHSLTVYGVALLAGIATATPLQKRGTTFEVKTRRSIDTTSPSAGSDAMRKAYSKFGFSMRSLKRQATTTGGTTNGQGQTGVVAAVPEPNLSEYLSPVNIGGQNVTLDFDTGSSDLYVNAQELGAGQN